MRDKICLTTYVYGIKYQQYIPLLVYSCHKAYPEYDIILFVYDKLDSFIKQQILVIGKSNLKIVENSFSDCKQMSSKLSQCLRWLLWDESFIDYDYIYTVDIDMFYIREPMPLHEQHVIHMKHTGLVYDNMKRVETYNPYNITTLLFRFKNAGVRQIYRFLVGDNSLLRASGLHFVDVKEYYKSLDHNKRNYYKELLYTGKWLNYVMFPNDEAFLYYILEDLGLHPERLASQTNSIESLNYNDCSRSEFRPHHGIHLGIFRANSDNKYKESDLLILNSEIYNFYIKSYEDLLHDGMYQSILNELPKEIKNVVLRMHNYYKLA